MIILFFNEKFKKYFVMKNKGMDKIGRVINVDKNFILYLLISKCSSKIKIKSKFLSG